MDHCKIYLTILLVSIASRVDGDSVMTSSMNKDIINCSEFSSVMRNVRHLVDSESTANTFLVRLGIVPQSTLFRVDTCNEFVDEQVKNAKILIVAAQFYKNELNKSLDEFKWIAEKCMADDRPCQLSKNELNMPLNEFKSIDGKCMVDDRPPSHYHKHPDSQSKYRSIDGRGNNLKNPDWGASDTPFARYIANNYQDGIYSIRKSVSGSDLPNARHIVQEVLLKAVQSPAPPMMYNMMALTIILFATHDLHYQVPMQIKCSDGGIRCCSKGSHHVLPTDLSNTACLPIHISENDPFYKTGNIGCQNMVRSQIGNYQGTVEPGQILNHATAFLDLSLIYGNRESELRIIRLYRGGKLRMGKNNVLPVDSNGKHIPSMDRFISMPAASIFPALFARNHNHLAERLAKLKPNWDDETLFQEARRINIANFQYNLITVKTIEKVFHKAVNASYSPELNAATLVEFAVTYRGGHYYMPSHMLFQNENNVETKYLQSDTIGKIELLENDFDGALRGALHQPVNVGRFSDELINRIGKNAKGYGLDIISWDIQRGRDHGIPSFVQIRRACKLTPEINSFDDFNKIFNRTNVELLKKVYKSYEDVEFYVGGLLELFESVGNPFVGPTFGCIIGTNYNNAMGGDRFFYSHPENPYPFTEAQLDAIKSYHVPHIYCANSGLKEISKIWSHTPNENNPKIKCKNVPLMDLSAWA